MRKEPIEVNLNTAPLCQSSIIIKGAFRRAIAKQEQIGTYFCRGVMRRQPNASYDRVAASTEKKNSARKRE